MTKQTGPAEWNGPPYPDWGGHLASAGKIGALKKGPCYFQHSGFGTVLKLIVHHSISPNQLKAEKHIEILD